MLLKWLGISRVMSGITEYHNGELLEDLDCLRYVNTHVARDKSVKKIQNYSVNEGYKAALKSVKRCRTLGVTAKKCFE